jgi:hypothetical protein
MKRWEPAFVDLLPRYAAKICAPADSDESNRTMRGTMGMVNINHNNQWWVAASCRKVNSVILKKIDNEIQYRHMVNMFFPPANWWPIQHQVGMDISDL